MRPETLGLAVLHQPVGPTANFSMHMHVSRPWCRTSTNNTENLAQVLTVSNAPVESYGCRTGNCTKKLVAVSLLSSR